MSERLSPQHIAAIRTAPLFSALDAPAIRRLLTEARIERAAKGKMLFGPSQKADRFFVVLSGRIKIYKLSRRGEQQILHLYGRGETFGQAAMFSGTRYPAYAEAADRSDLLVVTRACLARAVREDADLALAMIAGLAGKLREFGRLIEDLSLKDVPARLAGALLEMAAKAGSNVIRLPQTKRELAAQLGTAAETLSRALAKLKSQGLIAVKGSQITLLDAPALKALAEAD